MNNWTIKTKSNTNNNSPSSPSPSPITESGPMYRSVSMTLARPSGETIVSSSSSTSPPHLLSSPHLHKAHSQPMPCYHRRHHERHPNESHAMPHHGNNGSSNNHESSSGRPWVWNPTWNQLLEVPMFHPLERTAITCSLKDYDLETITSRISKYLRLKSIESHYHENGRVDAHTDSLVKFVIQLWKTKDKDTNADAVIVEIQRRQGCCIVMQGLRHELIHAIQHGIDNENNYTSATNMSLHARQRDCLLLQQLVASTTEQPLLSPQAPATTTTSTFSSTTSCLESAMELTVRLLSSDRVDAQRLGLESLCVMTDPTKVLLENAIQVSQRILMEEEDSNRMTLTRLLKPYFSHVEQGGIILQTTNSNIDYDDDDMLYHYQQGEYFGAMHLLALKILSQSLECLVMFSSPREGTNNNHTIHAPALFHSLPSLSSALLASNNSSQGNSNKKSFWLTVVAALYYNVQVASTRPMEASYAIRSLRYLQMIQPEILDYLVSRQAQKEDVYISLIHAHDYGRQYHRLLEYESQLWLGRLGLAAATAAAVH